MLPGARAFWVWTIWKAAAHARATLSVSLTSSRPAVMVGVEMRYFGDGPPAVTQVAQPTGMRPLYSRAISACTRFSTWATDFLMMASRPPPMWPRELVGLTQASTFWSSIEPCTTVTSGFSLSWLPGGDHLGIDVYENDLEWHGLPAFRPPMNDKHLAQLIKHNPSGSRSVAC